jgi:hypothetical protein
MTYRALCEPYRHKAAIRAAHRRHDFSGEPAEVGWKPGRVAQAWAELMHRLGYTRYVGQCGDVGASGHRARDDAPAPCCPASTA